MKVLEGLRVKGTERVLSLTIIVAGGTLLLIPPAVVAGRYSILEASVALLAAAALATRQRAEAVPSLAVPAALLALLLLMTASTAWSSASWHTFRDSIAYLALAATAWLLVKHGGLRPIVLGVLAAGLLIIVATAALLLFDPAAAFYNRTSALEAIYRNRNEFGAVMLLCLPAAMALPVQIRGASVIRGVTVALFLGAIFSSQSKTSMVAAVLVVIAWGTFLLIKRSRRYGIALVAIALGGIVVALVNSSWVLRLLGKDDTLSGRLGIWAGLADLIPQSPVIGFGFLREWPVGSAQSVAVTKSSGVPMIHAHNEVLSWLSAIGIVGLIVIVALYALVYWAGWRIHRMGEIGGSIWLLLTMVMLNVRGLAETSETNPQGWFVFMLAVFACARYLPSTTEKPISKWLLLPLDGRAEKRRADKELGTIPFN